MWTIVWLVLLVTTSTADEKSLCWLKLLLLSIPGVAKLLGSLSHFSKFDIFRKPQLNKYLKDMQKSVFLNLQKLYLLKTYK